MVVPVRLYPMSPPVRKVGVFPVEEAAGLPVANDAITATPLPPLSPMSPPAASSALAVVPFASGWAWEYDAVTSPLSLCPMSPPALATAPVAESLWATTALVLKPAATWAEEPCCHPAIPPAAASLLAVALFCSAVTSARE